MAGYNFKTLEAKWQADWDEHGTFVQPNPGRPGFDPEKPKFYVLDMFPYPSGAGLHVGHPVGYVATDIIARYKRMRGFNVLHPMGYDAFGLPAQQYAVEHGIHPRVTTERNIENIERQIKRIGFSYDGSRRLATTDPAYYRWTQWIFSRMFNSWYDPAAGAARPISELIDRLESNDTRINFAGEPVPNVYDGMTPFFGEPLGTIKWQELPPEQRREIIDSHRLAYMAEVPVNWCPALGTVLANEEVTNEGRSDRGDHPVFRRPLTQWMLRITAYADRLLDDLDLVDWPEPIKLMQRHWIGRSAGAEVDFPLQSSGTDEWFADRLDSGLPAEAEDDVIRVYTTRPDTLYGATYMVLAPEHPLVERITTDAQRSAVAAYVAAAARKSELERTTETKQKTGVFTGAFAVNPVNRQAVPVWIADYVMTGYGTGAIMAVPAHDTRDFDFAKQHGLPIKVVVVPDKHTYQYVETGVNLEGEPTEYTEAQLEEALQRAAVQTVLQGESPFVRVGLAVNSGPYAGMATAEFVEKITADLESAGLGRRAVNYRLRDWIFSRQWYWGEPFPIVHCPACGAVALPDDQLPLVLPEIDDFRPAASDDPDAPPAPPLGRITDWVETACPSCGKPAKRETNAMPQWAGSCWYYLRFCDPANDKAFCGRGAQDYWMGGHGVDLYVGGAEHAVLHLLYARFWHKVLYDLGHVGTPEPFGRLFNQGMIRSFAYRDGRGMCVAYEDVDLSGETPRHRATGEELTGNVEKMSKSLKNVVNPDEVIGQYGADTLRLYEMFMGPLDASKPWNTRDVPGVHRFCHRVWRIWKVQKADAAVTMVMDPANPPVNPDADPGSLERETRRMWDEGKFTPAFEMLETALHRLIKKVGEDIEAMKFNTAIAAMMEFVNLVYKAGMIRKDQFERFVLVLAPFAPHLAEELWAQLGHGESLAREPWPAYDEALIAEATVELAVQVNGKVRGRITVAADADEAAVLAAALAEPKVADAVEGKQIVKKIVVPGRLVNLVVK